MGKDNDGTFDYEGAYLNEVNLSEERLDHGAGVPIVLDTGIYTLKAGFAGECMPEVEVRTVVGRPRHQVSIPIIFLVLVS